MSTNVDARGAVTEPAGDSVAPPGGRIGRFAILEVLGQGGMGIVLAAYDPDLDRRVALKLLHPGIDDLSGERLVGEARAMAKLAHPNVIAVHEIGSVDGKTFIAMEFASGGTLHRWLATPRPWREVLDRFLAAGRGLVAAHEAGLVHRDFKPENVLLTSQGEVRVADFGLVSPGSEPGDGIVGTPAYIAPELRDGRIVGPAADQYAFCVSIWEGLFGARPSDDEPPSGVPVWLRAVIRRGLRADPDHRWPSMSALLEALSHDPIAARRRRVRTAAVVAAATVLVGVALFGLMRTSSARETRCTGFDRHLGGIWDEQRRVAVRLAFAAAPDTFARTAAALDRYTGAWVGMRVDACRATHERGEQSEEALDLRIGCLDRRLVEVDTLVGLLVGSPTDDVVARAVDATARLAPLDGCDDVPALRAVIPPPRDPAARAEIETLSREVSTAVALERTGQFRAGLDAAKAAAASSERVGYAPLIAQALWIRALLEERMGDPASAVATAEQGMLAAAEAHDDRLGVLLCSDLVFYVGDRLGRKEDGLRLINRCDTALRRADRPPDLEARLSNSYGLLFTSHGNHAEARRRLEHALALWEKVRGPEHYETATTINNLANISQELGRYEDARRLLSRSLAIREQMLGSTHPDVGMSSNNLGNAYLALGDYAEAQRLHERGLAIYEQAYGSNHLEVSLSLSNLGASLFGQGKYEQARQRHQRAVEIGEKLLPPDHAELALYLANLGETLAVLGQRSAGRRHLERALAILDTPANPHKARLEWALRPLGGLALAEGKLDEARHTFERAIQIVETADGSDTPKLALLLAGLAETLIAQRDPTSAVPPIERAVRLAEARSVPALDLATIRFVHARAIAAREPARALQLARMARDGLAVAGGGGVKRLAEVDAWIRARTPAE